MTDCHKANLCPFKFPIIADDLLAVLQAVNMRVGQDSRHSNAKFNKVTCVVSGKFQLHAMSLGKSEDIQKDFVVGFFFVFSYILLCM